MKNLHIHETVRYKMYSAESLTYSKAKGKTELFTYNDIQANFYGK